MDFRDSIGCPDQFFNGRGSCVGFDLHAIADVLGGLSGAAESSCDLDIHAANSEVAFRCFTVKIVAEAGGQGGKKKFSANLGYLQVGPRAIGHLGGCGLAATAPPKAATDPKTPKGLLPRPYECLPK